MTIIEERAVQLAKKAWHYWDYSTAGAKEEEAAITEMCLSFGRECAAEAYEDAKAAAEEVGQGLINDYESVGKRIIAAVEAAIACRKTAALGGEK